MLPGLEPWLDAFWKLSTGRQIGMTYGPIPYRDIEEWSLRIPAIEEREVFIACIRAMDSEYLGFVNADEKERERRKIAWEQPVTPALFGALFG